MLKDFDDSVLGDPITYARIEQLPGQNPHCHSVYAWPPNSALLMDSVILTVLAPRKYECLAVGTSVTDPPVTPGKDRVLKSGLPGCPYRFLESGELPFTDGNPAFGLTNRRWRRPLIYNGMQVSCCQIYKYCPSLLWQ